MWPATAVQHVTDRTEIPARERARAWVEEHPVAGFVVLAYAFSWTFWALSAVTPGVVSVVLLVVETVSFHRR